MAAGCREWNTRTYKRSRTPVAINSGLLGLRMQILFLCSCWVADYLRGSVARPLAGGSASLLLVFTSSLSSGRVGDNGDGYGLWSPSLSRRFLFPVRGSPCPSRR
jgi:hypothetical protein